MKRILSMLLIWAVLISILPVHTYAADVSYTVTASEDQTANVGDTVSVQVAVGHSEYSYYNAYDLVLIYDTSRLELISASAPDSNAVISESENTIRIMGYGKNKFLSDPVAALVFTTKAAGTANVSISSAAIDRSLQAKSRDASAATILDLETVITIASASPLTYSVTLEEGLAPYGNQGLTATKGEDYYFKADDTVNYNYNPIAKINGREITVTVNTDGTYKIPGDEINGAIVVYANRTGKTHKVSIIGKDVTGEKEATYGEDYSFTLDRKDGYHYTVEVTIGGVKFTDYTLENNVYTIRGDKITGDIKIEVTRTEDDSGKVNVQFIGSGAKDGSGQKKTPYGVEYPFKVRKKKGYTYSVSVRVNGKKVSYDYDYELDTYYILSENVTGDITIIITKLPTVEVNEYITLDKQSMYLIAYNGHVKKGQTPRYDGRVMYWSDNYKAYVWLVVSDENEKKVKRAAEEAIAVSEGGTAVSLDYSGNVNLNNRIDVSDAQLTYDMYNVEYLLTDMEMVKFLNADVNGDRRVDVRDSAAIMNCILGN